MLLRLERLTSPIGPLSLVTDEDGAVRALDFSDGDDSLRDGLRKRFGAHELEPASNPSEASSAIEAYFDGEIDALDALTVVAGGAPFQRKVWAALRKIPVGQTTSYGRLAADVGHPKAARAVGFANHVNPVAIIVPCHRVLGANGALTGYASGMERKRWLLEHEGARAGADPSAKASRRATPRSARRRTAAGEQARQDFS